MPELPEVQTTVNYLNRAHLLGARFADVWLDWMGIIKKPKNFEQFRKEIKNKKIINIWRRAKNIIFDLSNNRSLLIHQKMTGHLLYGRWEKESGRWKPVGNKALEDPYNQFLHLIFFLDNDYMLALSDLRKFAKVELWETEKLKRQLEKLGPEPLDKSFTLVKFKEILKNKKGRIKDVLMNQKVIAGIGNIYASEILWQAKIHPQKEATKLKEKEIELLYRAIKEVLALGVKFEGESFSDYRKPDGTKGGFDKKREVYRREGRECRRCRSKIKRIKISGRSTFFCPVCQKP